MVHLPDQMHNHEWLSLALAITPGACLVSLLGGSHSASTGMAMTVVRDIFVVYVFDSLGFVIHLISYL